MLGLMEAMTHDCLLDSLSLVAVIFTWYIIKHDLKSLAQLMK
jgi:hypothetical protein